jgi:hypothetical protein
VTDEWIETNRAKWDERLPIHVASEFYDVEGCWLLAAVGTDHSERVAAGDRRPDCDRQL